MTRIALIIIMSMGVISCDDVFSKRIDPPPPGDDPHYTYLLSNQYSYWYSSAKGAYILDERISSTYDSLGRLQVRSVYIGDEQHVSEDYEYDKRGNLVSIAENYIIEPNQSSTVVRAYDSSNRIIRNTYYEYDLTLQSYSTWQYEGATMIWRHYDSDDNLTSELRTYYNDDNLPVRCESVSGSAVLSYTLHYYHDNGLSLYSVSYNSLDELTSRTDYEYNGLWQLARKVARNGDGSLDYEYRYSYDVNGNLARSEFTRDTDDPNPDYTTYDYEYVLIK